MIRHIKRQFVNLHAHTSMSLQDSTADPRKLVEHAKKIGYKALACTDHGNMFAAIPFSKACNDVGIKGILGTEIYFYHKDRTYRPAPGEGRLENNQAHLILLATNEIGYKNLCVLTSEAYLSGFYYKPRIDLEILAQHSDGIIALSACLNGILNKFALSDQNPIAIKHAEAMKDIFGKENFFLEVQPHPMDEQRKANGLMRWFKKRFDFNYVLTLDSHYIKKEDWEAHDALTCIAHNNKISDTDRMKYMEGQFYLRSPNEVYELGYDKEFHRCRWNTVSIAERCNFKLELDSHKFPTFPKQKDKITNAEISSADFFEKQIGRGLLKLYGKLHPSDTEWKEYQSRAIYEAGVIKQTGFIDYFLIVSDLIKWAKRNDILVGPRGSVTGSLIAYLLNITNIDPIKYKLSFERFLSKERIDLPDIDLDIEAQKHAKLIEYITKKYKHVVRIMTTSKMQAKSSVKDVARVLDIPFNVSNCITKLIPDKPGTKLSEAIETVPALAKLANKYSKLFELAIKLEGTPRHASLHAGGYIISPSPITNYMPVFEAKSGSKSDKVIATQGDMNDVVDIGFVKFDFLRIRTLDIISATLASIKKYEGKEIDIYNIPLDDKASYCILREGKTEGVFQMGSSLMKHLLKQISPKTIDDIALVNAIARPGAEQGASNIIKHRQEMTDPNYQFEELIPVLQSTNGEFVYQEQLIEAVMVIASFTFGEADLLRRGCSKKKIEIMEQQRSKFIKGGRKNGHEKARLVSLFNTLAKFANYAFNRAHSYSYSITTYWTAFLKANYTAHFFAAMLTKESASDDGFGQYVQAAKNMGIKILPLNINKSKPEFVFEKGSIRYGFCAVKTIGEATYPLLHNVRHGFDEMKKYGLYFVNVPINKTKNSNQCNKTV